jgi:hypothetical protein
MRSSLNLKIKSIRKFHEKIEGNNSIQFMAQKNQTTYVRGEHLH